jgi:type I restriction-modification system DNA methylase subunit
MDYASVLKESGKVGVETRLTPARRFSYLVGEGESCHTAQTRFVSLLEDTGVNPTLTDIEEAFSVEAVTKEFFTKYTQLFRDLHEALERLTTKDKTVREEFKSKGVNAIELAKKLLGQIVFLYFLQKKGWLGVPKGQEWGTGPHDFLRRLANSEHGQYDNFFNDVLEPLFYDTLATDRGHDAWCSRFKCRIPFLNGGLFEPLGDYNWRKVDILLSNNLFTNTKFIEEGISGTGVLDVFDRYNFTVNEAEPLEKEVAIDPEMLGKVFENLIEENRRKGLGAYYTPREIVHYMCQKSLVNYLDERVNREREVVAMVDIETLVHLREQISHESASTKYAIQMPTSIEKHARLIDEALAHVTVCDPAVGSGAFPVGMMTEIVRLRCALTPYFNDFGDRTPYHFKRHAIQQCLYGVDIDRGAIEIAKLRLWLSLVVDEEDVLQIKPLPNLDYKIVGGNSLLNVEKNLFNESLFKELEGLKPLYFDETDSSNKEGMRKRIESLINKITEGRKQFDFTVYFSEVFHRNSGFDIVIGNPPYGIVFEEKFKSLLVRLYSGFKLNNDIYTAFIERGMKLLCSGGDFAFITPNTYLNGDYFKSLRLFLSGETPPRQHL